jgi:hypothetical protein
VLRETMSRGLCGLVCPSRTSERGGKGFWVCLLLQYLLQSCSRGGTVEGMCYERLRCVCLLLQYLLQNCSRGGGGETMEDMCYERLRAEACVD